MPRLARSAALSLPAALIAAAAMGQTPTFTAVVLEGDFVSQAGGLVFRIDALAINNVGTWLVEADTSSTDTTADVVVLKNSFDNVFGQENQAFTLPAGANISSFDSVGLNNNGDTGWNLFLRNQTTSTDSGIFFNFDLVFQESFVSESPVFAAPTPYIGFFEVKMNDNNQLMVMASVDDPTIASTVDRAIVILDYTPATGAFTENVIFKEADALPGQVDLVTDFGTGPHTMAFNNSGTVMFVADLTGATTTDGVVYIGSTLVAQEGQPSIVPDRNWMTLSTSVRLDLNSSGEGVWTGTLAGDTTTDLVIVTTTRKVIQEGDTLADIGGTFTFTGFGTGPVYINDDGEVLWFGDWNDPDTSRDTGLFIDNHLLVQEGVTTFDVRGTPMVVQSLVSGESGYAMSDNGRYIIFECVLRDEFSGAVVDGAVVIDRGDGGTTCFADFNTDTNVDPDDLADFITCFFLDIQFPGFCPQADFNADGSRDPDDLADFITTFFLAVQFGC